MLKKKGYTFQGTDFVEDIFLESVLKGNVRPLVFQLFPSETPGVGLKTL